MPFIYFLLLLAMLIKWILPYLVIIIVVVLVVLFYNWLKGQNTISEEKTRNDVSEINISNDTFTINSDEITSEQQDETDQDLFLNETIENCDSENTCCETNVGEDEKKVQLHANSFAISQIILGVLNHAMQREEANLYKTRLKLQILSREQAHLLHNTGQLDKEIDFIKKEIEFCNLDSYYYRYWTILLKKRMLEYEQKQKSNTHLLLVSQIISGLLNHAMQQEIKKEVSSEDNIIEGLYPSNIKENEDNNNQIDSADNNMWEYSTKDSYDSEAGNNNHPINKVPYWEHTYVYSASYLENANQVQKQFYNHFKEEFLKGHYLNIEDNSNYVFVLMFDLCDDYKKHKNYDLLKLQLDKLAENYPVTARYTSKTLLDSVIAVNQEDAENTLKFYDKSRGQLCRWITSEEVVDVQGIKLTRGNFYIGECFLLPNNIVEVNHSDYYGYKGRYIYASVLNPKLPVNMNENLHKSIFCSYYDMSPTMRYEYLMWLSRKKEAHEVSTDILLFYLYGCEIRMFIDPRTKIQERKEILDNIIQLYFSLNNRLSVSENTWMILQNISEFVGNSIVKYFRSEIDDFKYKKILKKSRTYVYSLILKNVIDKDVLFPVKAFDMACKLYDIEEIVPINYISIAQSYFIKTFVKETLNLCVDSEVSTLNEDICFQYNKYNNSCFCPERINLYYQIESVPLKLWNIDYIIAKCYDDIEFIFRPYNREKKYSGGKETIMAILFLPLEVDLSKVPSIQTIVSYIENEMQSNQYLVRFIDWVLDLFGFNRQEAKTIHINYIDSIISGLHRMGFGIVPNYKVDKKRFNFGDTCIIYKNREGYSVEQTLKYEHIGLFIKLASYVVLMDKVLEEDFAFVEQQVTLYADTAGNQRHLSASIRWRFSSKKRPPIDKQVRNAIEALTNEQCALMGNALMKLACIDGDVHPKRVEGLKKILPLLGVEVDNIHSQIHRILTDGEGFATIEKKSDAVEFAIDTEIGKEGNHIDTNIILNSEKLHIFEQQTKNAQELLSEIFVDDDIPVSQNTIDNPAAEKWKDVLTLLLSKEKWEREEIENKCQEMGLMLGAVLEQINDFAYEKVDDVVVEDDGEYLYVTLDYKEKLI